MYTFKKITDPEDIVLLGLAGLLWFQPDPSGSPDEWARSTGPWRDDEAYSPGYLESFGYAIREEGA